MVINRWGYGDLSGDRRSRVAGLRGDRRGDQRTNDGGPRGDLFVIDLMPNGNGSKV